MWARLLAEIGRQLNRRVLGPPLEEIGLTWDEWYAGLDEAIAEQERLHGA